MRLLVLLWKLFSYPVGAAIACLAIYEFWFFAQILNWVEHNPATTRFMDARLEALRKKNPKAALEQEWAGYGQKPAARKSRLRGVDAHPAAREEPVSFG